MRKTEESISLINKKIDAIIEYFDLELSPKHHKDQFEKWVITSYKCKKVKRWKPNAYYLQGSGIDDTAGYYDSK